LKSLAALLVIILTNFSFGQDYLFFKDSPNDTYYDQSFGFVNTPSYLELALNNDKFPVDTAHHFSGKNSLKLHWISRGGDWGIAVADSLWSGHDVTGKDSITFMAYSDSAIDNSAFPKIYIEDLNNNKTNKFNIGDYNSSLTKNIWKKVSVPLSIFKGNPGNADLTKIKTIYFGENVNDSAGHTIYLDDIKIISNSSSSVVSIPAGVTAKGYDKHIDIKWNPDPENNIDKYKIYRFNGSEYKLIGISPADITIFTDFLDSSGVTRKYKVSAVNSDNIESGLSSEASGTTYEMNDDQLLTMLQEATFRYFWDYAHPVSGLARERLGSGDVCAIGGSGFGVMAILVGIERGFITRDQGVQRILKILNFLSSADRFHGAFPHWMNGTTGKVIPFSTYDDGGDLVETSYLMEGLLTAREYFDGNNSDETDIRNLITNLWQSVEWNWYDKNDQYSYILYWHWSPDYGWIMNFPIQGYNEAMIVYLLAIASPTHAVSKYFYDFGWAANSYTNGKSFYGIPLFVGQDYGGPLFFAHYSFLGFDPRNKKDKYANYFINNRNHTLINRAYCIENPHNYAGYDSLTWGLTASDDPIRGYLAHQPDFNSNISTTADNGTISPTAAISSMPYTPEESIAAFKNMYMKFGAEVWGPFGFKDAFNISQNWYADSYIAIDEGPIIDMVENYRSRLLWNNFMANPEIQPMLDSIGFKPDFSGVNEKKELPDQFVLEGNYPNPFNPSTTIKFSLPSRQKVELKIFDVLGRNIRNLFSGELNRGSHQINWNGKDGFGVSSASGIYIYTLKSNGKTLTGKMVLEK
jgi:hypothetical protein